MTVPFLLSVQDLSVRFNRGGTVTEPVKPLTFHIHPGECLGMVGASGSGKSLTALAILRLTDYLPGCSVQGALLWGGEERDLNRHSRSQMEKIRGDEIALVFQEPMTALNPVFSCGKQVLEVLRLHEEKAKGGARERVLELFRQVELKEPERIFAAFPHQLSGGQKQRVLIAMALAGDPRLLIADEPTTALDVTVQRELIQLLRRLQKERNMSLLFVSHDLGIIRAIADRVVVMQAGAIVESGPTAAILDAPQHAYTRGLIACRPPIDRQLNRLPTLENPEGEDVRALDPRLRKEFLDRADTLLRVVDLEVVYPQSHRGQKGRLVRAVRKASFEMRTGERLGLVGESGSGKTTLGKALVGLVSVEKGQVYFQGDSLVAPTGGKAGRRTSMQMIFQDPYGSLDPRMPVGESIGEALRRIRITGKEQRDKIVWWLERVGLEATDAHRYPHQFSGGQRQRICIARALCLQPELLICDESVSALDVGIQAQILNLLKELSEQLNFSLLFISHDMSVIRFLCDRVLVMQDGTIVEEGPAEEVFSHPTHPYTQQLLQAVFP